MQISYINILKKLVEKAAIQRTNSFFIQDGDPSQNSRNANNTMYKVGAKNVNMPARSPDMNPIKNVLNYLRTKLHEESLSRNITFENFEEYSARVKKTLPSVPVEYINKTIESMNNRLSMVVKTGGKRIKY